MAGVSKQKQKLLIMEQLFNQRTDESHAITGNQLIDILGAMGIKAERKTIYDDIATLCDAGLNIETTKIGHSNAYYMGERLFTDEELKALANAVASSKYLTIKRSNEIIKKLQTLTSEYHAPALRRSIHNENRTKTQSDAVYRAVDVLQEAILSDRCAEFTCTDNSGEKKKGSKRAEERVTISPYQIVWECERYYVICWCEKQQKICRYRAEKLTDIAIGSEKRHPLTEEEERELRRLKSGGELGEGTSEVLKIQFIDSLTEAVCEKFGDKVQMHREKDGCFTIEAEVKLSPNFWGWLFGLGDGAKILAPQYAAEIAGERLKKLSQIYAEG